MKTQIQTLLVLFAIINACSGGKYIDDYSPDFHPADYHLATPDRITAGNESNFAPSLSPNGAYVIYTSDKTGNKDLWEKSTDGGYARQLTFHSADDYNPVLSPNGKKIAFVSRREDATGDIQILDLGGFSLFGSEKKERSIESVKLPQTEDTTPEWFPDSSAIVFSSRRPGEKAPQIMITQLSTLVAKPIEARGDQPSVSPDGQKIVFVRDGALYIYHLDTEKTVQLTDGGFLQDGQPKFTPDGESILFIRYADDTNEDGLLNADDRSSIWTINLSTHNKETKKENYAIYPLTTPQFSAYYPQVRGPFLYMTLQTHNGLDVFKIPAMGQVKPASSIDNLRKQLEQTDDFSTKMYLIRLASSHLYRLGQKSDSAEVELMGLEILAKADHRAEFNWIHKKFLANFGNFADKIALSKLLELVLAMKSFDVGMSSRDLTTDQLTELNEIDAKLSLYENEFSKIKPSPTSRINAYTLLIRAQILAARRDYFKAYQFVSKINSDFPNEQRLCADASLFEASLLPLTSDITNALQKVKQTAQRYPSDRMTALAAGKLAVSLAQLDPEHELELLMQFKEDTKKLVVVPAVAHRRIADIYQKEGKSAVFANELRQIVDLYPDSPEVVFKAAEQLMPLEESAGRYEYVAATFNKLLLANNQSYYKDKAKSLLLETMIHHGEQLLRDSNMPEACEKFKAALAIEPKTIGAHRGIIDCMVKMGKIDAVLEEYQDEHDNEPENAISIYNLGYASTYLIDIESSPRLKLSAITDAIKLLEQARSLNSQIVQVHQTLGWLYFQKGYWTERYYKSGAILGKVKEKSGQVLSFFGASEPNWLQQSIESYHTAYFLAKENSLERATLALNLGQTYYELKNYQKALTYYLERIGKLSEVPLRDPRSEGLLFRRSGRSAFQIEELKLAIDLQKAALTTWEKLNAEDEVSYSLDALALTYRELKQFKEAILLYERLDAAALRNNQSLNRIGVLSNLGYCHYSEGNLEKSLLYFNDANNELESVMSQTPKEGNSNGDSIQVDLGGQGSAAKGFNLFARGNLILSFKAAIYGQLNRKDLERESLLKKLALMTEHRDKEISENGKSEKFLAEEISILQNNIAMLELEMGNQNAALMKFKESEQSARLLRPEDQIYKTKSELLNVTNVYRLQLRAAVLDLAKESEINQAITDLEDTAKSLEPIYADGSREQGKSIANLLAIASNFKSIQGQVPEAHEAQLAQTLKIIERGDLSIATKNRSLIAYNMVKKNSIQIPQQSKTAVSSEENSPNSDANELLGTEINGIQAMINESKDALAKNPEFKWKIELLNGDISAAIATISGNLAAGIPLRSPVDRRIFRRLHEIMLLKSLKNAPNVTFESLRDLINARNLEILVRNLSDKNHKSDQKNSFESMKERLKKQDLNQIKMSLSQNEHALIVYRFVNGSILTFLVSKSGLFHSPTYFRPRKGIREWTQEKASIASQLQQELKQSLYSSVIKPSDSVYIVPVAELHDLAWEKLSLGNMPMRNRNIISFVPSIELIPEYYSLRKLPKAWIGWLNPDSSANSKLDSWFAKILAPSQSHEEILPNGLTPMVRVFRDYNIVHISTPFTLLPVETSKSSIEVSIKNLDPSQSESGEEENKINSHKDDFNVSDLLGQKSTQLMSLIFQNVRPPQMETYSIGEGQDGWVFLSLASVESGIPSIVLNQPANSEDDAEIPPSGLIPLWKGFYENLALSSLGNAVQKSQLDLRLYGHFGIHEKNAQEFAKERIEKVLSLAEDAYDDGDFMLAADYYREVQYYNDKLGKTDNDVLDRIVASLFQLRDFSGALHFKTIATQRLKPGPKGSVDENKDPVDYGNSVIEAAVLAVRAKKHKKATELLDEAEKIFTEEEDYAQLGKIAQYRGIDSENQKDYQKTIEWYKKSQALYGKVNSGESIQRLLNIGNIYNARLSEYARAIEYYDLAEVAYKKQGSRDYIPVLIDKGNALITIGQVEDATVLLERVVLPSLSVEKDRDLWVRSTQLLASAYLRLGLLSQAKELNEKTIQEAKKIEDPRDKLKGTARTIDAIGLRAYILSAMGHYKDGFEEFKTAINLADRFKLKGQLAVLYNNYGFWAREYGALDESIKFFNLALKYDEEMKSKSGMAVDQRNLALSIILKGDLSQARELLKSSLKTSEELNLVYNTLYCHFGLGDILLREKKYEESKSHFNSALNIASKNSFREFQWKSLAALGEAEYRLARWVESANQSSKAIATIEKLRSGLKSESSKSQLQSEKGVQEVYQTYAAALMKIGHDQKAWTVAEKARGRSFLDTIVSKKIEVAYSENQTLIKQEQDLRRQQESQLSFVNKLIEDKGAQKNIDEAKIELQKVSKSRAQIIQKMYRADQKLLELVTNNAITQKDLSKLIPSDTAIIEYFVTKDQVLSWFITKDEFKSNIANVSQIELSKMVQEYRTLIENYSSTEYLGRDLSKILLDPFKEPIKSKKRLVIIPHMDLHFLSFASISFDNGYLIDRANVTYLDSATSMRYTNRHQNSISPQSRILAFLNPTNLDANKTPLPFSEKEGLVLKRYFNNVDILKNEFAKESMIKSKTNYDIIHIGAHGEFLDKFPENSNLILSPDQTNDGYLTISEIFKLNLGAKMVTLSACDSGMGSISSGDEIVGMNKAFFFSGAQTVVSALWRINDVTSAVTMKRFYRNLSSGQPKDMALANAQKTVREYFKHPAYWAPFRIVGDWN